MDFTHRIKLFTREILGAEVDSFPRILSNLITLFKIKIMAYLITHPRVQGLRRMFLLVTPNETSFETVEQVPKYVDEVGTKVLQRYEF